MCVTPFYNNYKCETKEPNISRITFYFVENSFSYVMLLTSKGSYRFWKKIVKVWMMMNRKEELLPLAPLAPPARSPAPLPARSLAHLLAHSLTRSPARPPA